MIKKSFDIIILGAGSGGVATAIRAAKHGAKVAIVESGNLGGTCVNLGCVPKKIMFNASMIAETMEKALNYCFSNADLKLNWKNLVIKRNNFIASLRESYAKKLKQANVSIIKGEGSFHDQNTVLVNGSLYQAPHIVIATGGEPSFPIVEGVQHIIDSDGFFGLTKIPYKVAIIGGGYIGVELAGILNTLGSETHLILRGSKPLSRFDATLSETLMEIMHQQGIQIHPNHKACSINLHSDGRKSIVCQSGSIINSIDVVIAATGRKPRTYNLNLEKVHVQTDEHGLITVDAYQNSSTKGIYAIGDVTNAPALTPVAIAAGRYLADRLFANQPHAHLNHDNISSVVFSHPPIGTIGLSEEQALKKYGKENIKIYQTRFIPLSDALSMVKTPTVMKLITLGKEEKIIGLHVIGHNADEMLQGFAVAIKMGACKKDFDETVAIHPSAAEELVTMV